MKKTVHTRAKLLTLIARATTVEDARKFAGMHTSPRIDRAITRRVERLSIVPANVAPAEKSELEVLIERFTREGKPNPEKSARASIARRAQLKAKVA